METGYIIIPLSGYMGTTEIVYQTGSVKYTQNLCLAHLYGMVHGSLREFKGLGTNEAMSSSSEGTSHMH